MNIQVKYLILTFLILFTGPLAAQSNAETAEKISASDLFGQNEPLHFKLNYSQKDLRKLTNDSTYLDSQVIYSDQEGQWNTLDVKIRVRGNNRLQNCYYPPVKLKFKKSVARGTIFEGNRKLKLVLPCLMQKEKNDLVLKEYLAYKLFEVISPYHFRTRLVAVDLEEERGNKIREHQLRGFLIEDMENVAERHGGHELKRFVHPLQQENVCSVRNDFFQFMIANTDFSIAYQHNQKLLFLDKETIPVPYDFDMSGLVDANYAVVSQVQGEVLEITEVTQRLYRGFKRNPEVYEMIRKEYIDRKDEMMAVLDSYENDFEDPKEFERAKSFLADFFYILQNDKSFKNQILAQARLK